MSNARPGLVDWSSQLRNKPFHDPRDFDWERTNDSTLQAGLRATADLSTAGAKTIVFSNLPAGLVAGNYVFIAEGVGTAEIASITSVTGDAGGSGSIGLTMVNTHTGAWSVRSASLGIQEALEAAASSRGMVAVLPRDGGYDILGPIRMPAYTTLMGAGFGMHRGQFDVSASPFGQKDGVTLSFTWGAGSSSGQQILMRSGCVVQGLTFNYPDQVNTATPTVYPPTIRLDTTANTDHCKIYDVFGVNPYEFVVATTDHSRLHVRGIYGTPINIGISIHNCSDCDLIEDFFFKGLYHDSIAAGAYDGTRLSGYTIASGTALRIDLADGIQIRNGRIFGYNKGVHLTKTGSRGSYGTITDVLTDSTRFGLYVDSDGISNTIKCIGCWWYGHDGITGANNSFGVLCTSSPSGVLILSGCDVSCTTTNGMSALYTDSTRVIMSGGWIPTWGNIGGNGSAIQIANTGTVTACGVHINGNFNGVPSGGSVLDFVNHTGSPPKFVGVTCEVAIVVTASAGSIPPIEFDACHDLNGPFDQDVFHRQYIGEDIASDVTIIPSGPLFRITGTAAVANIQVPFNGAGGVVIRIIPVAIFTWTADGNIALAGTAVAGRLLEFAYNNITDKWYPSYT